MSKRKLVLSLLLLAGLIGLTLYTLLHNLNLVNLWQTMQRANWKYLVPSVIAAILFPMLEGCNLKLAFGLMDTPISIWEGIQYAFTGFFFSSITPGASGGQPMQLYAMHRQGREVSVGLLAILLEFTSFQLAMLSTGALGYLLTGTMIRESSGKLLPLLFLGGAINGAVFAGLLLLLRKPVIIEKLAELLVKLVSFVSNSQGDKLKVTINEQLIQMRTALTCIDQKPARFLIMVLLSLLQLLLFHTIPYLVGCSLGVVDNGWTRMTALQSFLYLAVSVVPLPGAAGASEGTFYLLYQTVFPGKLITPALLLTRLMNFYLPLSLSLFTLLSLTRKKHHSH